MCEIEGPQMQLAFRRRDEGMQRAAEHAGHAWQAMAFAFALRFALKQERPFLTENVVAAAIADGLPEPPDRRAWGAIVQRVKRAGFIIADGYAPAATSNASPKVRWRKA